MPILAGVVWSRDGAPVANGKFGLSLSTEASGKSMKDIVGSLNGSGELRLGDTSVRGLNLGMLAPLLAATDPMQDQLNAGKVHPIVETLLNNGEAKLPPAAIPFNVTDGVLRVQNVSVATDQATVVGDGQIDLPQERINASLNIALNPGGEVLPGAEPAVRLELSGAARVTRTRPWMSPISPAICRCAPSSASAGVSSVCSQTFWKSSGCAAKSLSTSSMTQSAKRLQPSRQSDGPKSSV